MLGTWAGFALLRPEGAWPLLVAATLIGAVGLADDLSNLHFSTKAAAQTLVAAGLLLLYPPPVLSDAPGAWGIAAFAVGVFWIVALSNAFNFMDGIDGFMGGVALVNILFLASLAGEAFLPALAGATAGFLIWNINPASIFLGDSGAYFLGFVLAAVALYAPASWTPLGFFAGVLVFTPLLFDTAYTLVRRLRTGAGKNIFSAHREHIYQRITPTTGMHRRTSNLYYGASVVSGFAALLVERGGTLAGIALALACCVSLAALPRLLK
jgi:UDP-N-acetylmuramyl pentapeptide phosphotransferase/UDP-N-acetylglucosamine-1-phosphate transferase